MAISHENDADAFHAFERTGWESNVAAYDAAFARLTRQAIGPLLEAVSVRNGTRLLDVATGPGYVAAAAVSRGAAATGIDFSAPMIARARELHPDVEFREGDAEALAFADAAFDAVVMNFGVLHLARPERAMAEAARVLMPGGRYACTAWARPEEAAGFRFVLDAIEAHGNLAVEIPAGPPFFRFADPAECERTLRGAGFRDTRIVKLPLVWRFDRADDLFDAIYDGGVRIRAVLRAHSREAFDAIRAAVRHAVERARGDRSIELPMPAVLASGVRPV